MSAASEDPPHGPMRRPPVPATTGSRPVTLADIPHTPGRFEQIEMCGPGAAQQTAATSAFLSTVDRRRWINNASELNADAYAGLLFLATRSAQQIELLERWNATGGRARIARTPQEERPTLGPLGPSSPAPPRHQPRGPPRRSSPKGRCGCSSARWWRYLWWVAYAARFRVDTACQTGNPLHRLLLIM
jgi:hypothetical protein